MRFIRGVVLLVGCTASMAQTMGPDLVVDQSRLASSWRLGWEFFPPGDCAIVEGCVLQPGYRKLLRFSSQTANIGKEDLFLGNPSTNPLFEFSPCHGHYHFGEYAEHELRNAVGDLVAPGLKTGFCLLDSSRYIDEPWVPISPQYGCSNQGITRGWSDIYGSSLDCQWIDVTDVPDGDYSLEVTVNPEGVLPDIDLANNTASVTVTVGEPSTGVPHRPDGTVIPGSPLQVEPDNGPKHRVLYDVISCPAFDYHLYYGEGPVSAYAYDGAVCDLGTDGEHSVNLPGPAAGELVWFVVVGVEGSAEGGHGFQSGGGLRPLSGIGLCGASSSTPSSVCD